MMFMMGLWLLVPLLLIGAGIVVLALAIGWRPQSNQAGPAQTNQALLEILNARNVRGEIGREEYEHTRRDLEG